MDSVTTLTLQSSKSQSFKKITSSIIVIHFIYSTTLWPQVRGGQLGGAGTGVGTACVPVDGIVLFFGANEEMSNVVTRLAVIKPLDLRQATAPGKQTETCSLAAIDLLVSISGGLLIWPSNHPAL